MLGVASSWLSYFSRILAHREIWGWLVQDSVIFPGFWHREIWGWQEGWLTLYIQLVVLVRPPGNRKKTNFIFFFFCQCLSLSYAWRKWFGHSKHLWNTQTLLRIMQNYSVVQIRQQILMICLLRTNALFIKDHHVFNFRKLSNRTTKFTRLCY